MQDMQVPSDMPNSIRRTPKGDPVEIVMKYLAAWLAAPDMCFHAEQFWQWLSYWSQMTFGGDEIRGPIGPLKHLAKEAKEAQDKPDDVEEYADALFLVFDATRRAGFTYRQLMQAVTAKAAKNLAREWPEPTADDVPIEHVRKVS
jgi:alkylhydroperoxidase family enzyme